MLHSVCGQPYSRNGPSVVCHLSISANPLSSHRHADFHACTSAGSQNMHGAVYHARDAHDCNCHSQSMACNRTSIRARRGSCVMRMMHHVAFPPQVHRNPVAINWPEWRSFLLIKKKLASGPASRDALLVVSRTTSHNFTHDPI